MWVFVTRFHIPPHELDNISVEDQNVLWTMLKYEQEKAEHDEHTRELEAMDKKHKSGFRGQY